MARGVTAAQRSWSEDPIVGALTAFAHLRASGEVYGSVARMDLHTRRYCFVAAEPVLIEEAGSLRLPMGLLRVASGYVHDVRCELR